jgi:hypothetical protein
MTSILRWLVLGVCFWLFLRFFQSLQPEVHPSAYQADLRPDSLYASDEPATGRVEKRAEWREVVDHQLHH